MSRVVKCPSENCAWAAGHKGVPNYRYCPICGEKL